MEFYQKFENLFFSENLLKISKNEIKFNQKKLSEKIILDLYYPYISLIIFHKILDKKIVPKNL